MVFPAFTKHLIASSSCLESSFVLGAFLGIMQPSSPKKKKKEAPTKVSLSFFFFSYSLLFFLFSPRLDIKKPNFLLLVFFFFFQIFLLLSLILAFYLFINRCLISVNLLFNSSVITIYYLAYNHGSHLLFPDRKSKIKYFGVIYPVLTVQSPGRPAPLRG